MKNKDNAKLTNIPRKTPPRRLPPIYTIPHNHECRNTHILETRFRRLLIRRQRRLNRTLTVGTDPSTGQPDIIVWASGATHAEGEQACAQVDGTDGEIAGGAVEFGAEGVIAEVGGEVHGGRGCCGHGG